MTDDKPLEFSETQILGESSSAQGGSRETAPEEWAPGTVVDERYELLDEVGQGGMGRVFKAEDLTLHEMVALKILSVDAARDPDAVQQFHREVKLARRVAHRNVVRTYDIGTASGVPFLTMEFMAGSNLRQIVRDKAVGLREVVSTASSIADGLSAAHEVGVLHRDLKPENVLVGESGRVALTDFGIAGALRAGGGHDTIREQGVGTPAYMAPEQLRGRESMDQRVDVYGLGLVVYEMIAGRLPWETDDAMALAVARVEDPAPSLSEFTSEAPPELVDIVDASLRRDPDQRPEEVEQMKRVFERLAGAEGAAGSWSPPALADEGGAEGAGHPTRQIDRTRTGDDRTRVVVLPFAHDDAPPLGEIATGIRQDLIYKLGYWEDLEIRLREAPRDASFEGASARQVGRCMQADAVVRGEIRETGGRFRLRAAVVSVNTGDQVWGDVQSFGDDEANEIGAELAETIGHELTDTEPETSPDDLPTPAHSLLMEGQHLLRERWRADIAPAIERLEQAHDRAPDHPRVLSQLAIARARQAFLNPDESDRHIERAVTFAREAIDRAGDQWAEPRYALAMAHFNDRAYGRAVATLRAALEREPDYAEAHELLGRIQAELGPLPRAVEHLERALDINPYLYRALPDLLRVYGFAGRWEEVDELAARDLDSEFHRRSRVGQAIRMYLWQDRPALERRIDADREFLEGTHMWFPMEVRRSGEFADEFRETIGRLLDDAPASRRKTVLAQGAAELAAFVEDRDAMFGYLDEAVTSGLTDLVWLRHCPLFDPYRQEPEFLRRLERVRGRVEALEVSSGCGGALDHHSTP
jgi:tetratricopeptide (TPR) repeat protein